MSSDGDTARHATMRAVRERLGDVLFEDAALDNVIQRSEWASEPHALPVDAACDMVIALAAARGDRAALERLNELAATVISGVAHRSRLQPADADEIRQTVMRRLLTSVDQRPAKIYEYAPKGDLRGLLAVAASRVAIEIARGRARYDAKVDAFDASGVLGASDAEFRLIRAQAREAFVGALQKAVRTLTPHDRNLLRMSANGVTLEQLALMYGKHRATVVRHLARVRSAVLAAVERTLREHHGIAESEVGEVLTLFRSRIDLSLSTLFGSSRVAKPPVEPPEGE